MEVCVTQKTSFGAATGAGTSSRGDAGGVDATAASGDDALLVSREEVLLNETLCSVLSSDLRSRDRLDGSSSGGACRRICGGVVGSLWDI